MWKNPAIRGQWASRTRRPPGLVVDLPFLEGTGDTVFDLSGNQLHATQQGTSGTTWEGGLLGWAPLFNTTNWFLIGDDPLIDFTDEITVSLWINPTTTGSGNFKRIVDKQWNSAWSLMFLNTRKIGIYINSTLVASTANNSIVVDTWQHIAWTLNRNLGSNQCKLYINGFEEASGTRTAAIPTNAIDLRIGADHVDGNKTVANIQMCRIWGRALSASEIRDEYIRPWSRFAIDFPVLFPPPAAAGIPVQAMHYKKLANA